MAPTVPSASLPAASRRQIGTRPSVAPQRAALSTAAAQQKPQELQQREAFAQNAARGPETSPFRSVLREPLALANRFAPYIRFALDNSTHVCDNQPVIGGWLSQPCARRRVAHWRSLRIPGRVVHWRRLRIRRRVVLWRSLRIPRRMAFWRRLRIRRTVALWRAVRSPRRADADLRRRNSGGRRGFARHQRRAASDCGGSVIDSTRRRG